MANVRPYCGASQILISVVIPLYNKKKSIERAIRSVLRQTHRHFELIVVDDGSTDGSAQVVKAITEPRLTFVQRPNGGVSAARNVGVERALGQYVAFLDADDEWRPEFLSAMVSLMEMHRNAVLFSTRHDIVAPDASRILGSLSLPADHVGQVPHFFETYRKSASLVNSSSVCVRKDALLTVGGFPVGERVGEDVVVWLKLAAIGDVMFDARVLSTAHQDAENRTVEREAVTVPHYLKHFLEDGEGRLLTEQSASLCRFLAHFCLIYAAEAVRHGDRSMPGWYARAIWPYSKRSAILCSVIAFTPRSLISTIKKARALISRFRSISAESA